MTTSQTIFASHFQAPVTEDPMELTSDIDQRARASDDIDIDLDLTDNNLQDGEDEFMSEEDMDAFADSTFVDGQVSHAANDDEMADDSYAQEQVDEEPLIPDEDIEDAEHTGPELDEDTIVEPDIDLPNDLSEDLLASYEETIGDQNHEQDYQEQEYNEQEHHERPTTPLIERDFINVALPNGQKELVNLSHVAEVATGETSDGYSLEVSNESTINHGAADQVTEPFDAERLIAPEVKSEQVQEEVLPASSDQEIVAPRNAKGSHTQGEDPLNSTDHLHPVVLDYQGEEMFLFPPIDQNGDHAATFLIADEDLAYSTIGNLLDACRGILKGSLSEQDELVININDLDLHISESTVESASTRLSEVVDLYVRLQQNDGLEDLPPLYMDLTSRNRFSRRLDVLRNALSEGKGLSQLKSSQETENDQQHRIEEETYPSGRTAVLSSDETYASRQKPGEEAEESMDQHDSHSNPLPSTNVLLEPDSARQGAQPYLITDVAHDEKDRTEPQTGSKGNPQEAGTRDDIFSESAESKESLGPAQPSAAETAIRKAEDSVVDHGDFIDYEDIEELEEGTSSASSTLQGDAFDVNAVQDHAVSDQSIVAENQELQSPNDDQENAVADEEILHEFKDEKDISSIGVAVQKEQPNLEEVLSQDSDDKGQSLPQHSNEEWEAPENDQDASISQETESRPKVNADDDQYEASAPYEDDAGSYQHDTLPEHPDQKEDDAYPLAESSSIGEIEDHSSTHPFQSESSGSGRNFRDDDLGRVDDLDAENELDESDRLSANDENNHIPHPPEGVDIQTSLAFDESAPTQEDDDEITYEDEEYDTDFPHESAKAEHNVSTSPGFHKRARSFHEDSDDALGEDLQGAKRFRSG